MAVSTTKHNIPESADDVKVKLPTEADATKHDTVYKQRVIDIAVVDQDVRNAEASLQSAETARNTAMLFREKPILPGESDPAEDAVAKAREHLNDMKMKARRLQADAREHEVETEKVAFVTHGGPVPDPRFDGAAPANTPINL